MEIKRSLEDNSGDIIDRAVQALNRANLKHYEIEGTERTRLCLKALYDVTARCLEKKNIVPIIKYAENIARRRFSSGFGLYEVQTAFNALEEAIWVHILERLEPTEFFETMGLVSTILGAGKDALARNYVSLAGESKVPSPDPGALSKVTHDSESAWHSLGG